MSTVLENKHQFIDGLTPTSIAIDEAIRKSALKTLETSDLPTTRTEAWKYTRVAKLAKVNYTSVEASLDQLDDFLIAQDVVTLVFVNGYFSSKLSSDTIPTGVTVKKLSECSSTELPKSLIDPSVDIFSALNTAYLNDGVWIDFAAKAQLEKPMQILHIVKGEKVLSNFKTIITAGSFSKASVIQGFFAADAEKAFTNSTTEIHVGENAFLTVDKIQFEDESTSHISTEQVSQGKDSTFTINTVTLNGGLVRNNLNIDVRGENCTSNLNGTYLLKNKQHVDNHTVVDHIVPNCNSNELYKGVIDNQATAVFNGKVFVRKDAQKINAFQSNGNVLLTNDATANSKPELEIYADDVKCSHGSTTGQLDEEAVFYLRARGLSETSARQLMVSAFIGEVLDHIENEDVLDYVKGLLKSRFGWDFR
ncbi:MAG: Fe-S cluster assembly protein SufD [Crocinitomicaceae bacterium]|jgi:Fe-S cluster assembly protein SufD